MKKYDVEVNGVKTTLNLSDADARARGLLKAEPESKAKTPANKARTASNKQAEAASQAFGAKKADG